MVANSHLFECTRNEAMVVVANNFFDTPDSHFLVELLAVVRQAQPKMKLLTQGMVIDTIIYFLMLTSL